MIKQAKNLYLRITGGDKKKTYPDQQADELGRIGDKTIIFPYGLYCDLPINSLIKAIDDGSAIPMTINRPNDLATGEVAIFNPVTGSKVVFRENGDIDINAGTSNITITAESVNIDASDVNINGNLNVGGNAEFLGTVENNGTNIAGNHTHPINSGSSAGNTGGAQ